MRRSAIVLAVVTASLCACSSSAATKPKALAPSTPAPVATPTTASEVTLSPSPTVHPGEPAAVRAGVKALQDFLSAWRSEGFVKAGGRYLYEEPGNGPLGLLEDDVVLLAGEVTEHQLDLWRSPDHFRLIASMKLSFAGDAGGWTPGTGVNTRFVTFDRPNAQTPYKMSLATSP